MPLARALIIGAAIIGASVLGSRLIAPYQISSTSIVGGYTFVWRLNTITGNVQRCLQQDGNSSYVAGVPPPPMVCP